MKQRNPFVVFILSIVTLNIYALVWLVKTKNEMNSKGANIPTAWLIIVPIVSIWWYWKYSQGVELITREKMSTPLAFLLQFLLGAIGMAIIQDSFNKVDEAPTAGGLVSPTASPDAPQPDNSFGGPVVSSASVAPTQPIQPDPNLIQAAPSAPTPDTMHPNTAVTGTPPVNVPTAEVTPPNNLQQQ